ncbi:unnamed protein product [Zymoseptoria tritici ST99CH_1E4]|uniref:PAC domain-containing protein n=1 Tax=Zymoseptoria tritici ST99CH_1E4 TaxID=1276532 RepID=A0A2H1FQ69_ZYMTR|nr:unnamed protein product [Zymoseptoria tritici ST99CH_1E4]
MASSLGVVNTPVSPLETPPESEALRHDYIGTDDQHDLRFSSSDYRNHAPHQDHHHHRQDLYYDSAPASSISSVSATNAIFSDRFPHPPSLSYKNSMSIKPSPAPPNGFDLEQESFATPNNHLLSNEPQQEYSAISGDIQDEDFDLGSFDLKPPPAPDFVQNGLEVLMDRVHSTDHLDIILSDPKLSINFFRFVENYHPGHLESIKQYSSARKALAALDFANALASQIPSTSSSAPYIAANLDPRFEAKVQRMTAEVLEDVLPAYVTFRLVRLATDSLVKEITGTGSPVMRTLIPDLATVYCISDPNMLDNPIVYASEEFHSTSLYSPSQALNRNCRFLQGPNTSPASVRRLVAAITAGQELCETILNYRRDGSPFVNLLMIAPLYDNKGKVRYYLGAQIDVSGLIEEGKGLESLATLLSRDQDADGKSNNDPTAPKDPDVALSALAARLSIDDAPPTAQAPSQPQASGNHLSSMSSRDRSTDLLSTPNTAHSRNNPNSRQRIVLTEQPEPQLYSGPNLGPSGRLPGVYQNYLLVRPYPSLRITFLSPSLRIPGLLQSAFLDRIAGPESIREGLLDAFSRGIGVTAKILWNSSSSPSSSSTLGSMNTTPSSARNSIAERQASTASYSTPTPTPTSQRDPQSLATHPLHPRANGTNGNTSRSPSVSTTHSTHDVGARPPASNPKSRWIHCTPLNGSDGKVGVWMVVMVEDENVTGGLKRTGTVAPAINPAQSRTVGEAMGDSRGKGVRESTGVRDMAENMTADSRRLYAEYLRGGSRARGGAGGAQQETDAVPGVMAVSRGADGTLTTTTRIRNVEDVFRGF